MKATGPRVGGWYQDLQTGDLFEIVAWDMEKRTIETQYVDGEISEYDIESWNLLTLLPAEEPEDWRSSFELDNEDRLDPDLPFHPEDWSGPVAGIEPEYMNGVEEF